MILKWQAAASFQAWAIELFKSVDSYILELVLKWQAAQWWH